MTPLRTETLDRLLESALEAGFRRIGQVAIEVGETGFSLCHIDDVARQDLETHSSAAEAMRIVVWDDAGLYRPLKTAPNLRHGWRLELKPLAELRQALDFIYPAALGNWRAWLDGRLKPSPLRDTVNRQTGMYRITGKITTAQAEELIGCICRPGCQRHILWPVEPDQAFPVAPMTEKTIPLLCADACAIFVSSARKIVKGIPLDQVE